MVASVLRRLIVLPRRVHLREYALAQIPGAKHGEDHLVVERLATPRVGDAAEVNVGAELAHGTRCVGRRHGLRVSPELLNGAVDFGEDRRREGALARAHLQTTRGLFNGPDRLADALNVTTSAERSAQAATPRSSARSQE